MIKLPSALVLANRAVRIQNRLFDLTRRYTDLLPKCRAVRDELQVAQDEADDLYEMAYQLDNVLFWGQMKRDLDLELQKAERRVETLGIKFEDAEDRLCNIERALHDAINVLTVR